MLPYSTFDLLMSAHKIILNSRIVTHCFNLDRCLSLMYLKEKFMSRRITLVRNYKIRQKKSAPQGQNQLTGSHLSLRSSRTRSPVLRSFLSCLEDSLSLLAEGSERLDFSEDSVTCSCLRCLLLCFSLCLLLLLLLFSSGRSWCLLGLLLLLLLRSFSSLLSVLCFSLRWLEDEVVFLLPCRTTAWGGFMSRESAVSAPSPSEKLQPREHTHTHAHTREDYAICSPAVWTTD